MQCAFHDDGVSWDARSIITKYSLVAGLVVEDTQGTQLPTHQDLRKFLSQAIVPIFLVIYSIVASIALYSGHLFNCAFLLRYIMESLSFWYASWDGSPLFSVSHPFPSPIRQWVNLKMFKRIPNLLLPQLRTKQYERVATSIAQLTHDEE
jgi:hypothetical protein